MSDITDVDWSSGALGDCGELSTESEKNRLLCLMTVCDEPVDLSDCLLFLEEGSLVCSELDTGDGDVMANIPEPELLSRSDLVDLRSIRGLLVLSVSDFFHSNGSW